MQVLLCSFLLILPICLCAGTGCITSSSLLEGRRRLDGAVLNASSSTDAHPATEARLDGSGWCSTQQGADIFMPYLEVEFATSVLFTAVVTEGFSESLTPFFLQRFQVEISREDGHFLYIATPTNSSKLKPAIFPLEQERITSTASYEAPLPVAVIGQRIRINPYQWNNNNFACTKLEVFGCPLQECKEETQLGVGNQTVVTVNGSKIEHDDLFNFDDNANSYCLPTNVERPLTITISFPSSVLITEVGIHGIPAAPFVRNQFVRSFSISYALGGTFVNYTRDNGMGTFTVSDAIRHFFGLWPPISTNMLKVTINSWQSRPCLNLLMLGCGSNNVVVHRIDPSAPTAGLVVGPVVTETTTETAFVSTTVTVTKTVESPVSTTFSPTPTSKPHPTVKPTQSSSTICSSDDDDDNVPIYVSIAIVVAGVIVTMIIVVAGVIFCRRRYRRQHLEAKSSDPLISRSYGSINRPTSVGVDNDLYGQPALQITKPRGEDPHAMYDKPPPRGKDNPTYGVLRSGEHSTSGAYSYPTQ